MNTFKLVFAILFLIAMPLAAPAETLSAAGYNAVADAAAAQTKCVSESADTVSIEWSGRVAAPNQLASRHLRCPAVTGSFCDNNNHVCCLVNNVYKCCPSLSHSCCRE